MPAKKANIVVSVSNGVAIVDVSTKKFPGVVTIIDEADLPLITESPRRWAASARGAHIYVVRNMGKGKTQRNELLHRVVLGLNETEIEGDHVRHDTLDNRREKLRPATKAENGRNSRSRIGSTSAHLGVHQTQKGNWSAQIFVNKRNLNLGTFFVEVDAARAYDCAAREHFGKFANLNFPEATVV